MFPETEIRATVFSLRSGCLPAGSIELGRWYHFAGVLDRVSGRMEVYAYTNTLVNESTHLGDGTPLVGSQFDSRPGALGFASYASATNFDGSVILQADTPTPPNGELEVSSQPGRATTETVTTATIFLELFSGTGQAFLTLDPAVVADNVTPEDLIADLNAAINSSGLAEQVTARLNAGHVEFVSQGIGSGSWLGTIGWSESTTVSKTIFSAAGDLTRDLGSSYGDGALGFGSAYAAGTDRSYIAALVPPAGSLPTTPSSSRRSTIRPPSSTARTKSCGKTPRRRPLSAGPAASRPDRTTRRPRLSCLRSQAIPIRACLLPVPPWTPQPAR